MLVFTMPPERVVLRSIDPAGAGQFIRFVVIFNPVIGGAADFSTRCEGCEVSW
jgi:hypothetical protein